MEGVAAWCTRGYSIVTRLVVYCRCSLDYLVFLIICFFFSFQAVSLDLAGWTLSHESGGTQRRDFTLVAEYTLGQLWQNELSTLLVNG